MPVIHGLKFSDELIVEIGIIMDFLEENKGFNLEDINSMPNLFSEITQLDIDWLDMIHFHKHVWEDPNYKCDEDDMLHNYYLDKEIKILKTARLLDARRLISSMIFYDLRLWDQIEEREKDYVLKCCIEHSNGYAYNVFQRCVLRFSESDKKLLSQNFDHFIKFNTKSNFAMYRIGTKEKCIIGLCDPSYKPEIIKWENIENLFGDVDTDEDKYINDFNNDNCSIFSTKNATMKYNKKLYLYIPVNITGEDNGRVCKFRKSPYGGSVTSSRVYFNENPYDKIMEMKDDDKNEFVFVKTKNISHYYDLQLQSLENITGSIFINISQQ